MADVTTLPLNKDSFTSLHSCRTLPLFQGFVYHVIHWIDTDTAR